MGIEEQIHQFKDTFNSIRSEIGKVIVGHNQVVEGVLIAVMAGGHALLEGVPGLGKTLLIRTLSSAVDLNFSRIQFTPDLMPADIVGTNLVVENPDGSRQFQFQPGPIFSNVVLADEINRATPKTQSALLEAMQEHSVTVGGKIRKLEEPFFVLATQNPIEMEGTYPLPEAQLDRFLLKLTVESPTLEELGAIVDRTTGSAEAVVDKVADGKAILAMRQLVREVPIATHVRDYALKAVLATHPDSEYTIETVKRMVRFGASPRAAQALILAAKICALLEGRYNVAYDDIQKVAHPVLRHRVILNFEGEAEGISTDQIITEILAKIASEKAVV